MEQGGGRVVAASSAAGAPTAGGGPQGWARKVGAWVVAWPPGLLEGLLAGTAFVGGLVLLRTRPGNSQEVETFTATPQFGIWVALIALQMGLWGALTPWLVRMNLKLRRELGRGRGWQRLGWQDGCYLALLVLLVVVLAILGSTGQPIPASVAWRIRWLTRLGLVVVGMPIFTGVWLLQETVTRLGATLAAASRAEETREVTWEPAARTVFASMMHKRTVLQQLLLAAGLIIGAATLATGALRLAVLAAVPDAPFPPAYPLLYGGFFTVVLAFVYLPAYLSLQRLGNSLVDGCWPVPSAKPDKDWYESRERASAALGLTVSAKDSFQAGAAILAPLLTSVLTVLLPTNTG